jgi:hypothetical protein
MDFDRFQWISTEFNDFDGFRTFSYVFQWISNDFDRFQWISTDFNGFQHISSLDFDRCSVDFDGILIDFDRFQWISTDFVSFRPISMDSDDVVRFPTFLLCYVDGT